MASPHFEIPEEFKDKIRYVDSLDTRSDQEILEAIEKPPPVNSEKNIWAFWHAGASAMPAWCQRNVVNWSRRCGPSWTIRVLNTVKDSPSYALNWVKAEDLPKAFVSGTMEGRPGSNLPHSADFLRGACLFQYGGVWLDVGAILFRSIDDICWRKLEDPSTPYQVAGPWEFARIVANHIIASRKGDPFIKHWHELFVHIWKDNVNSDGLIENPLLSFVHDISLDEMVERGFVWDWNVPMPKVLEYIAQILCWTRVGCIEEPNGGFNGAEYYSTKILLFDALYEDWHAEAFVGWNGERLFKVLATRLDADPESEAYKEAYKIVWTLLTSASMEKVTRTGGMTTTKALGTIWDEKENENMDREPGTFAELLRFGSIHFHQDRETRIIPPKKADVIFKGVLEP
ncbi:capsule polysaccharide biosynthesis protein [Colletotrichum musicola]|uniref:Capsule polysaccharide biosynthesis protein n=1 Tax=Colletotrichum musicola TaxID=2175873 RepID=A0A8H6JBE5_9PEZI|nr:capsule polysaccharide biosynthesis protein [Colletotrichum musicola]